MRSEKNKREFKNKKFVLISTLIITISGTMLLNNKNVENKNIAIEKDNKKDVDEEKKNAKEQLEELKKTDTSNLSDEEKKDLENKIAEVEKKVVNDNNSNSTEEVASDISNSDSNSTSSKNDSTENNSTNNNGTVQNKPNDNNTSDSNKHTHNWNPITSTIHHEEQGHYENILVSEAWTEEVPIYEEQARSICNGCGADITGNTTEHNRNHVLNGEKGGYHVEYIEVQVGTNKITHDAVYENKWVVDKAAWDETVTTGYQCSCGATK
ncbi:hypothetical protein PMY12_08465 [Clostridium tertium]|uniref:hypothetical protein n=1 Tax=Clostridium tertium TaxID=1559 RepID=UPI0023302BED|nr:hypothetical protein [Clostridium tertium]MDB1934080.1 hypothetical protein [Clostridium tertium]MDB1937045.1 hypothetical protein [Clostridium tertium]